MRNPAKPTQNDIDRMPARRPFGKLSKYLAMAALALGAHAASHAAVFTENFDAAFPAWEAGVFGTNSNARNFLCGGLPGCADRGSNPDGLFVIDPSASASINVSFNSLFGASLTSFSLDVAAFSPTRLQVFDSSDFRIFDENVILTGGSFTKPGDYVNFVIDSANGISRFVFTGDAAGNTSIDNVVLTTRDAEPVSPVPEPGTLALLGLGLLGCVAMRRRETKPV